MNEHEKRLESLEGDAEELRKRSEDLEDEIEHVRDEWERKKGDDKVPGALREAGLANEPGDDEPEADYPSKR